MRKKVSTDILNICKFSNTVGQHEKPTQCLEFTDGLSLILEL